MSPSADGTDKRWPKRRGDSPDPRTLAQPTRVRCALCSEAAFVGSLEAGRQWFEEHRGREHPNTLGAGKVESP